MRLRLWMMAGSAALVFSGYVWGQQAAAVQGANSKPKVFVTDSKSWGISGGFGGSSEGFGGGTRGGARPQTVEIIKTFGRRCLAVALTIKEEKADFIVLLDPSEL